MLFNQNIPPSIETRFTEFTEQDIGEILDGLGNKSKNWARYIYLVAGGGHPQLTIAAIQSMQNSGWDNKELTTLQTLLTGNKAIEDVRAISRQRLLNELHVEARRILERLSVKVGSFNRSLFLDIANVEPQINDAGLILEQLIGSWVDQLDKDLFSLSPLLTNLANITLQDQQKNEIHFAIANSIIGRKTLDPRELNSAFLSSFLGNNESAIITICRSIMEVSNEQLGLIAPHMSSITFLDMSKPCSG